MLRSTSDEPIQLLNPDTYLNHLAAADAFAFEIKHFILMVILGAALWDLFAYLPADVRIVRGSRFNFVIFCFMFSRLFALAHMFIVISPANNSSPTVLYLVSACIYMVAMMTSSFLFLQRVTAVYHDNKWVRRGFSILWLVSSLSGILIPLSGHPNSIPGTHVKKDGILPWVTTNAWLSFSFDTSVVLAISYKIWLSHEVPVLREGQNLSWYHLVSGKTLPHLSRSIFRGGLQYYLIIVGIVMITAIAMCLPSASQIYKSMFPTMLIFLMSSMASRVFRNTKLLVTEFVVSENIRS